MAEHDNLGPAGWEASAEAWVDRMRRGERNREEVLDPVMLRHFGPEPMRVLDIGCGEGRFCRMLRKRGHLVLGLDPTEGLLKAAKEHQTVNVIKADALHLPAVSASFDRALFYLSLIDIEDFRKAIQEAHRVLKPRGKVVVANLSNLCSASETGWHKDEAGNRLHWKVDNYMEEIGYHAEWDGISIVNFHRPLSAYFKEFLDLGMRLEAFEEPAGSPQQAKDDPYHRQFRRMPFFQVYVWAKP